MPAALIPAIIGAGGIIGGSLIGKKAADNSANQAAQLEAARQRQMQPLIDLQTKAGQFGLPAGEAAFGKSMGAYGDALDFYKKIMTGSSDDIMKLFDSSGYTRSADEAAATAYSTTGRGGARAAVTGNVTEDRAANVNRILASIRAGAPNAIAGIAGGIGNLGLGALNIASGSAAQASSLLNRQSEFAQEMAQQAADRRAQLISGIIGTAGSVAGVIYASRSMGSSGGGGVIMNASPQSGGRH